MPFFGCDADSFGLNCTTNQFFHNSLALSVPFSTGKPCFLPSQASFLLHFFVDAISGCFWVANEQEDVVTYPCDGLPNKPLFFGLVAIQQNAQPLRIELSQAFEPVLSRHTAYDYLTLLHQRLHRSLQRECAFFSAQLPVSPSQTESQSQSQSESQSQSQTESQSQSESALESQSQPAPQSENALRFHAKKTSYLLHFHALLFCAQLRFACPFPAGIVDALAEEVRLRQSVCRAFPTLFAETGTCKH